MHLKKSPTLHHTRPIYLSNFNEWVEENGMNGWEYNVYKKAACRELVESIWKKDDYFFLARSVFSSLVEVGV